MVIKCAEIGCVKFIIRIDIIFILFMYNGYYILTSAQKYNRLVFYSVITNIVKN